METPLALLIGLNFAGSVYLILSRALVRVLIGIGLLGNGVNLLIFVSGRLTREVPAFQDVIDTVGAQAVANPLPQALGLTAIVISFSLFAFLMVLGYRSAAELGTDDTDSMRTAEPAGEPRPPTGY